MQWTSDAKKRRERDGDYMVELSKTMWAVHVSLATEMAKIRSSLVAALPWWIRWLYRMNGGGRMNKVQWTSDAPTEAGFYWHRNGGEPRIVWVVKSLYSDSPDELEIYFPGQDYSHAPEECKGEWCGPILPPE